MYTYIHTYIYKYTYINWLLGLLVASMVCRCLTWGGCSGLQTYTHTHGVVALVHKHTYKWGASISVWDAPDVLVTGDPTRARFGHHPAPGSIPSRFFRHAVSSNCWGCNPTPHHSVTPRGHPLQGRRPRARVLPLVSPRPALCPRPPLLTCAVLLVVHPLTLVHAAIRPGAFTCSKHASHTHHTSEKVVTHNETTAPPTVRAMSKVHKVLLQHWDQSFASQPVFTKAAICTIISSSLMLLSMRRACTKSYLSAPQNMRTTTHMLLK